MAHHPRTNSGLSQQRSPGTQKLPEWRNTMTPRSYVKSASVVVTFAAVILAGTLSSSRRVRATGDDDENRNDSRVQRGLEIAPVPLNLEGKNRALVGLGSYLVNAHVPCNERHGAGPSLTQFLPRQNPYCRQPAVITPATYFGGGRDFGAIAPGAAHIISRNLTPDKTGLPVGRQ